MSKVFPFGQNQTSQFYWPYLSLYIIIFIFFPPEYSLPHFFRSSSGAAVGSWYLHCFSDDFMVSLIAVENKPSAMQVGQVSSPLKSHFYCSIYKSRLPIKDGFKIITCLLVLSSFKILIFISSIHMMQSHMN